MSKHPMFSISKWNMKFFQEKGRTGETHYIGNGVNFEDFPIEKVKKQKAVILVEGWECGNPSKDFMHIGPKIAAKLKSEGAYILAYSQLPLKTMPEAVDEFYYRPDIDTMNDLYRRASILIKASVYDARACAPVEAMTKGTPTARAITKGDDDIIHGYNGLRCGYSYSELYSTAKELINRREEFEENCINYVKKYNWSYWMEKINDILCGQQKD